MGVVPATILFLNEFDLVTRGINHDCSSIPGRILGRGRDASSSLTRIGSNTSRSRTLNPIRVPVVAEAVSVSG